MRTLAFLVLLLPLGCNSAKSWGQSLNPASSAPANACGREPAVCPLGAPQCTTDANGCTTCTCLSKNENGFNIVNSKMDPAQH